jgi:cyclophilin family peptidyl-prolyl cis-trans isomerase
MGVIKAELWSDTAPITVKNFLAYADGKHYDGLIFHRVIQGFMIQGGGLDPAMKEKATRAPIKNEASVDKKNDRGTLAMARTGVVDSATSQFFINLVDNKFLDHRDKTPRGFGYCAFGKVTEGMDVVDKIAAVAVANAGGHQNVPTTPVLIKSIRRGE